MYTSVLRKGCCGIFPHFFRTVFSNLFLFREEMLKKCYPVHAYELKWRFEPFESIRVRRGGRRKTIKKPGPNNVGDRGSCP
jgi:hypothetical protein